MTGSSGLRLSRSIMEPTATSRSSPRATAARETSSASVVSSTLPTNSLRTVLKCGSSLPSTMFPSCRSLTIFEAEVIVRPISPASSSSRRLKSELASISGGDDRELRVTVEQVHHGTYRDLQILAEGYRRPRDLLCIGGLQYPSNEFTENGLEARLVAPQHDVPLVQVVNHLRGRGHRTPDLAGI